MRGVIHDPDDDFRRVCGYCPACRTAALLIVSRTQGPDQCLGQDVRRRTGDDMIPVAFCGEVVKVPADESPDGLDDAGYGLVSFFPAHSGVHAYALFKH